MFVERVLFLLVGVDDLIVNLANTSRTMYEANENTSRSRYVTRL